MKKYFFSVTLLINLLLFGTIDAAGQVSANSAKHTVQLPASLSAPPAVTVPTTAAQLNYVIKQAGSSSVGAMMQNLTTGQMIYQHNAEQPYVPASNLKIFTATAALEYLTPGFQYKTYIASRAPASQNGVFHGDMYLVFSGDPSLTREDINDLFQQLKQRGIGRIMGNVYLDDSLFDYEGSVPDALPEDASYCFSAGVFADNIDHNCIGVTAAPSPRTGAPAIVNFIQSPQAFNLINQITTGPHKNCNIIATPEAESTYLLSGCIPYHSKTQSFSVSDYNMRIYSKGIVQLALKQARIELDGRVIFGKKQGTMAVLAQHQSDPLSVLVKHMLKESDNLYANAIVKTLGAYYYHGRGSWKTGTAAVMAILTAENQINFASAQLVDGAGLSRLNMITPAQMMQLLATAYQKPAIFSVLMEALPIAGVDGTLKRRLTDAAYRNNVHAKTGTMSGVSSLSGYLTNRSNQIIAFSIMINDSSPHPGRYRKIEDTICKVLILSR